MSNVTYTIEGLDEMQKKLGEVLAGPLRTFLEKAAEIIGSKARTNSPVDTGVLRGSINTEVDSAPMPLWAKVSSDQFYARFVEYGAKAHFAPVGPISSWAGRHGIPGGAVGQKIASRGIKGKFFLFGAKKDTRDQVRALFEQLKRHIEEHWAK